MYFALDAFARYDFDIAFDDPRMDAFWSKVDAAGLPVFFETSAIPDYDRSEFHRATCCKLHGLMDR